MGTVTFDAGERQLNLIHPFNFTANPSIAEIYPLTAYADGGRTVTVKGSLLNVVQHPQMILVRNAHESQSTSCTVISETEMTCPSPSARTFSSPAPIRRRRSQGDDSTA